MGSCVKPKAAGCCSWKVQDLQLLEWFYCGHEKTADNSDSFTLTTKGDLFTEPEFVVGHKGILPFPCPKFWAVWICTSGPGSSGWLCGFRDILVYSRTWSWDRCLKLKILRIFLRTAIFVSNHCTRCSGKNPIVHTDTGFTKSIVAGLNQAVLAPAFTIWRKLSIQKWNAKNNCMQGFIFHCSHWLVKLICASQEIFYSFSGCIFVSIPVQLGDFVLMVISFSSYLLAGIAPNQWK